MMDLRDSEAKAKDAAAVKRDDFDHARESYAGLRQLARATLNPLRSTDAERKVKARLKDPYQRCKRVNASVPKASQWVTDQLDDAQIWLQSNRDELMPEIEREDGRLNSARREYSEASNGTDLADLDNSNPSGYELAGQLYVGERACYAPLEAVSADLGEYWDGSSGVRLRALQARGGRLRRYHLQRSLRLRWRGMEEWEAVAKADAKLAEGLKRTKVKSGAKPLPPIARLHELFAVRGSDMINRRLERVVTSKQVKIDGSYYLTSRIAYAIASGSDPADQIVRDGEATSYRDAKGFVSEREGPLWDARVKIGAKDITIGEYRSEEQALEAVKIYLRALTW